jgi:Family of unknown function (DUF6445)
MSREFRLHSQVRIHTDHIGTEAAPVIVIDDFLQDAERLVRLAAVETFVAVSQRAYPGIRAPMPPKYAPALQTFLCDLIRETFGLGAASVSSGESHFSIVTQPAESLQVRQRMPHYDSTDPRLIALLHYLCEPRQGGTSFYRHRATGFEAITPARLHEYDNAVAHELGQGQPVGYINGTNAWFERIAAYESVFNRLIIYRSASLHSGDIPQQFPGNAHPRYGRLTANTFFLFSSDSGR